MKKQTMQNKIYFSTSDVAAILGVSVKTATRWLKREQAGRKIGGRWKTSRAQLIAAFPEALRAVDG